jgi:hypothetical protein
MKMLPIKLFGRLLEGTALQSLTLGGNNKLYPTIVCIFIWWFFTYMSCRGQPYGSPNYEGDYPF